MVLVAGGTSALLLCLTPQWAPASDAAVLGSGADTNGLDLIPERDALWSESMLWEKDVVVRFGLGYKDNILLSPLAPQGSAFFLSGLDLTVLRLPMDGLDFNFSVTGDDTRYWKAPDGVKGEDLWLARAQLQKYFANEWRAGMEAKYIYADQVLEELVVTGGLHAVQARGSTVSVRPFVRRDLGSNSWLQLEAPVTREWWQSPLDPDWKSGLQLILGCSYGFHSELSLTCGGFYIAHADWLARDAAGNELPGRTLDLWRQVFEFKWEHVWDARQRWCSTTKGGLQSDQDNGGGYFDYDRYFASEELRYRAAGWEIKAGAGVSYYDFLVQTLGTPPSPTLNLVTLNFSFRAERQLYKSVRGFAAYEHEQAISNDPESEYRAETVTAGLSLEF